MNPFSLCVYCGSRAGDDVAFTEAAHQVGQWLGQQGGQLVYGGGGNGLMGVLAQSALAAGAKVIGVIPDFMVQREWAWHECTELHIVKTMHERKALMAQKADAFLALPGGIGTLEELFEIWTWRQLGAHDKPIGVLNVKGYYDPLKAMMAQSLAQGFFTESTTNLVSFQDQAMPLLESLHALVKMAKGNSSGSMLQ